MDTVELKHLQQRISQVPAILLYFYNDQCAPCIALRPKVIELMEHTFPKIELQMINASGSPDITSAYGVFSSPVILVFFDGKEVFRGSKYISTDELENKIARYYSLLFD